MERKFRESKELEVRVIGVSNPGTIMNIAKTRGLDPQDVFVRAVLEIEAGEQINVSQKLRILGRDGYEKLIKAYKNDELINVTINEDCFFYLTENVSLDDLFKNSEANKQKRIDDNLSNVRKLIGIL